MIKGFKRERAIQRFGERKSFDRLFFRVFLKLLKPMGVGRSETNWEGSTFPLHTPLEMMGLSHGVIARKGICVALIWVVQFNSGQASALLSSSFASWPPLIRRWLSSSRYATHFFPSRPFLHVLKTITVLFFKTLLAFSSDGRQIQLSSQARHLSFYKRTDDREMCFRLECHAICDICHAEPHIPRGGQGCSPLSWLQNYFRQERL